MSGITATGQKRLVLISGRAHPELAEQIATDYAGQSVTLLGVLNGSLMFVADLVRQLTLPTRIGFIQASSYRGATTLPGELVIHPHMIPDVRDRHVLLLDDILDTGKTLSQVIGQIRALQPQSVRLGVLLRKRGRLPRPERREITASLLFGRSAQQMQLTHG